MNPEGLLTYKVADILLLVLVVASVSTALGVWTAPSRLHRVHCEPDDTVYTTPTPIYDPSMGFPEPMTTRVP